MKLADKIKTLAEQNGITIAELERRLGLSNSQIRRWNNASPSIKSLNKVAMYFNVSVDYLIGNTDDKKSSFTSQQAHDVGIALTTLIDDLSTDNTVKYYGKPMATADKVKLRIALSAALQAAQVEIGKS